MKVFLLGYMASGKSTIGEILAKKLKVKHIDLDRYIEKYENKSIFEIFKSEGELKFRKLERHYLEEVNRLNVDLVISLGGGTPCYYDSIDFINQNQNNISFYLRTNLDVLVKRLESRNESRPIVNGFSSVSLHEQIGKHLFERSFYYNKAHYVVDNVTIEGSIKQITRLLR